MGDIFREIDEELRQERYDRLWRRYGRYAIGAAVAVVVAVAAYTLWDQYRTRQQLADGGRFAAAQDLLRTGRPGDAAAMFAKLAAESTTAYGALARFHQAALRAKSGDSAGAIALYDGLAEDDSLDKPMRDLAAILSALNAANGTSPDSAALRQRLQPFTAAGNPWRYSALEILAILAHRQGDAKTARTTYQQIVDDVGAPENMRVRASQMLAVIGK